MSPGPTRVVLPPRSRELHHPLTRPLPPASFRALIQARARVLELHEELSPVLQATGQLPDGLAMPHRLLIHEGPLSELGEFPRSSANSNSAGSPKAAYLFNDLMVVTSANYAGGSGRGRPTADVISLAKVRVSAIDGGGGTLGAEGSRRNSPGGPAFELWSASRVWRFRAPSAEDAAVWVSRITEQARARADPARCKSRAAGCASRARTSRCSWPTRRRSSIKSLNT